MVDYTHDEKGWVRPWSSEEKKEIAQLRKTGHDESYIFGWMKMGHKRRGVAPPLKEKKEMATKKKAPAKKPAAKKKATAKKKAPAKKVTKKTGKKVGRKKGGFQCGEKITAVKNQDDMFYKQFPRYKAYQLICSKGSMATTAFVDAVEKLEGVKSRGQALGILQKLIDKDCIKASGKAKAA